MKKILIVDDSKIILSILETNLSKHLNNIEILSALNYQEALSFINKYENEISVAIIDLHLPDSKDGAMIDLVEEKNIKSVILSEKLTKEIKEIIFHKKNIVDCIAKDGDRSIKSTIYAINRILKNENKNILIVEDSKTQLAIAKKILDKMNLNVFTASNGKEALEIIEKNEIKFSMVLTDYNMPIMDGMELTFKLREKYQKDELAIIVLSANDSTQIAEKFLKIGANDYINKPYKETEVTTRVNANLDLIDLFQKTNDLANKDFLTNLYNKKYFIETCSILLERAKRKESFIAIAMLDINRFKKINDIYGHDVADLVLVNVAKTLEKLTRKSDVISRFNIEEFCLYIDDISIEDSQKLFEKIKNSLDSININYENEEINFSVSIGVCHGLSQNLESMIKTADLQLYNSKDSQNHICIKHINEFENRNKQ